MKKNIHFAIRLLTLLLPAVLFFACSDLDSDTGASGDGEAYVRVRSGSIARTALPQANTLSDFTLKGKNGSSETVTLASAETLEELSEKVITVRKGSWLFTLSAHCNGVLFSGEVSKNIEAGTTTSLSFLLTTDAAYGGFSVTVSFEENAVLATGYLTSENESPVLAETELEITASSEGGVQKNQVTFARAFTADEGIAAGTYRATIRFYADTEKAIPLCTYTEIIRIAGGYQSLAERFLSLDETYSIEYDDGGGSLQGGESKATLFSRKSIVQLPRMKKENEYFRGWYDNAAFSGSPVTEIPAGTTGNQHLYAKYQPAEMYVSGTGDDVNGDGSEGNPFESLDKACEEIIIITEAETDSGIMDWTIFIMGDVTGPHDPTSYTVIDKSPGRSVIPADVTSEHARSILLTGYNGPDTDGNPQDKIDRGIIGNSGSTSTTGNVLAIATEVPVTIKNVMLTGGDNSSTNPNTDNDPFYVCGGGLYIADGATVTLDDGVVITNNKATKGGGVYNAGTLYMVGSAAIGDKTVTSVANGYVRNGNCSNEYSTGGGVYNIGELYLGTDERELTGGIYYSYGLTASGGGIYNTNDGITVMSSGTIAYNDGAASGAGVYVNSGTFTMIGGSIDHNSTGGMAGGVYVNKDATFIFSGGKISANWATGGGGGVYVNASESKAGIMYMYGTAVVGDETQTSAPSNRTGANATDGNGAGICVNGGKLYMGYSSYTSESVNVPAELTGGIYYNYCNGSTSKGGGLFASDSQGQPSSASSANATVRIYSGIITNNYCEQGGAICTPSGAKPLVIGGKVKIPSGANHGNDILIYGNYNRLFIEDSLEEITSTDPIYIKLSASDGKYWSSSGLMLSQNASITSLSEVLNKFAVQPLENPSTGIVTQWVIDPSDGLVHQNTSTLYVGASGSTGNDGLSVSTALPTLEAAVRKMTDASVDYTIILNGEITGCQQICNWEGTYANSITVKGKTGSSYDIINANLADDAEGSALSIETNVPVTLSGITIKGGNGQIVSPTDVSPCAAEDAIIAGGGLYLAENAKVSLVSSTKIIENHSYYKVSGNTLRPAPGCGAGAYVSQGASLYIDSGSIISDNTGTCYGAGVYVAQGGFLRTQAGSGSYIKANSFNEEFVDSSNEHVTPCGGGVYLEDGSTFEMYGCYIRENSVNDGLGSGIYVGNAGSDTPAVLKMSGYAQINLPNDVYLQGNAPVYIAGKINADLPARLTPESYAEGIKLVELSEEGEAANITLSTYAKYYEITPQNTGDQTQYWFIDTSDSCKLAKQTGMGLTVEIPIGITNDDIEVVVTSGGEPVSADTKIPVSSNLVFTAKEGMASYTWTLDGEEANKDSPAAHIYSPDTSGWVQGSYVVYLEAKDSEGKYYSYTAQITVSE